MELEVSGVPGPLPTKARNILAGLLPAPCSLSQFIQSHGYVSVQCKHENGVTRVKSGLTAYVVTLVVGGQLKE